MSLNRGEKLSNQCMELPIPDAAHSVAAAPLCLLSVLAAHAHVRRAEHVVHVSPPEAESDCQIGER